MQIDVDVATHVTVTREGSRRYRQYSCRLCMLTFPDFIYLFTYLFLLTPSIHCQAHCLCQTSFNFILSYF